MRYRNGREAKNGGTFANVRWSNNRGLGAAAAGHLPGRDADMITRLNAWLAVKITDGVGTMWCAYAFAPQASAAIPAAGRPIPPSSPPWTRARPGGGNTWPRI